MAVQSYFPRAEFAKSLTPVAVDYLAQLAKQVKILQDLTQAQLDIEAQASTLSTLQDTVTALEQSVEDVPLLERPGGALAFAIATTGTSDITTATVTASEAIAAGDFCNFYASGGAARVRRADGSDVTKFANCFSLVAIASGAAGVINLMGLNTAVVVATPVSRVFLSDATPGGYTDTAPSTAGHIVQPIGEAINGVGVLFAPQLPILL